MRRARNVLFAVLGSAVAVQALRWWPVFRSVAGYREYWKRRAERPGELLYVALGDSLAQGVGASHPERGYVGLLAAQLERETWHTVRVLNLSVTGVRLADLLDGQLTALRDLRPDVVTLAIGANDAGRTDPATFRADFDALCAALPAGSLVADVPDFQAGARRAATAELAAVTREVLAGHPELVRVTLEAATSHLSWRDYCADLHHPSDAGHRRYAEPFLHAQQPARP